jgi:sugar/nucleoside kinase (ribokinase family)
VHKLEQVEVGMADRSVVSFGETLIDLIATENVRGLDEATTFVARPGGAPANVAVALARLGVPSAFCGVVGADPFGEKLRRTLDADGVDVSRLRVTDDADTTLAFAWKDARGDGHFRLLRMADCLLDDRDVDSARIEKAAAIVVGSVALSAEPSRQAVTRAVTIATDRNVPVCFDVNMRSTLWPDTEAARDACAPILERATLLKLSLDDAQVLFGPEINAETALAHAAATGARFTVLTDGARGAWYSNGSTPPADHFVPAFPVEAVEPTGAGDAFNAAIISCLLARDWTELRVVDVRFAAAAGALTTTRSGAIEALPTRFEIESFMEQKD